MVKKIALILFFIFILSIFGVLNVKAQVPTLSACGVAGGINNSDLCCNSNFQSVDSVKNQVQGQIPPLAQQGLNLIPNIDPMALIGGNILNKQCLLGQPENIAGVCYCKLTNVPTVIQTFDQICTKYLTGNEQIACIKCADNGGVLTGLGCIPLNLGNFITDYLFGMLLGLAGMVAIFCIIYSAFRIQTSQANPERLKKAQETLTSCIMGLLLVIFSVFILRLIGITILRIPGFGQ